MKFKPLHDRVLIEVLDGSEKTTGGIIIPDTAQEKPQEGKVVAIGGGAKTEDGKRIPMDVKVGDKVLFGKCLFGTLYDGFVFLGTRHFFQSIQGALIFGCQCQHLIKGFLSH